LDAYKGKDAAGIIALGNAASLVEEPFSFMRDL
jgi:hypothetical protein